MNSLYLIDGYAQFFRHYHAIRTPMTSPVTGEPTNMTFGFVGLLLKLLRGQGARMTEWGGPPTHLAVALDVSGDRGTFRSTLYPAYKATRDAPPEDLAPQVERCLGILRAIGVPILGAEGFEADDVIAAIAGRLASDAGTRVRVVSKDKDLKQLLAEAKLELYDAHTEQTITAADLHADAGITPAQVIDMLALMGDTVDNVPGVAGIGPKTAAQLIAEFGSLESVLEEVRAEKPAKEQRIKGKRRENILASMDALPLSRELVTLRTDVPIEFDLEAAAVRTLHPAALEPILKELGFNRYQDELKALLGQLTGSVAADAAATPTSKPASRRKADDGYTDSLFASASEPAGIAAPAGDYRCVRTKAELAALLKELESADAIAVDTETTSLSPRQAKLCGLCFSTRPGSGWYVPIRSPEPSSHIDEATVLGAVRSVLEDPAKAKIGHNLKYDLLVLRAAGVELRGLDAPGALDTMVGSYLLDASRSGHSLDALALAMLGRTNVSIKDLIGSGKQQRTFDTVPLELATGYAAEDADVALQLATKMLPELREKQLEKLARELELPLVEALAELEWNGIRVDPDELDRQRERLEIQILELQKQIDEASEDTIGRRFDHNSPKQLAAALFNKPEHDEPGLGLKPIKRTKTGYSTDAEVLEKLANDPLIGTPIPALILEYRQLSKLVSTYLVALKDAIDPGTGRVHASFNQTVAATGRLSSSDPNLQNIPIRTDVGREIRRAFVANAPGDTSRTLVSADYSQIELRLLAHLSRDPALIEAFERGDDIHAAVAAQIHAVPTDQVTREQRNGAKMVNFGIVYGITAFGLARRLGVSNSEADAIITGYKKRFAGITTFLQECIQQARAKGYVETMLGRRRPIPDIESTNPSRKSLAERMAINSVVQGSAADLIKLAMVDLHARLSPHAAHRRAGKPPEIPNVRMLLQIHDELVFECDASDAERVRALVVDRMQRAAAISVPLVADASIAPNWFDGK
ncbi:MAG: DNA polymerase I [Phycisphaerales bacterium]|nr:MAG: DNA polymerase I [Phycisphaerales bacterium]